VNCSNSDVPDELNNASAGHTFLCGQMASLGQHRLADNGARSDFLEDPANPSVVLIARAKPGNQGAGVEDDPSHRPKSSRCRLLVERSVCVPFPIPLKSAPRFARDSSGSTGGSGVVGRRLVNSAWALAGSVSEPGGVHDAIFEFHFQGFVTHAINLSSSCIRASAPITDRRTPLTRAASPNENLRVNPGGADVPVCGAGSQTRVPHANPMR